MGISTQKAKASHNEKQFGLRQDVDTVQRVQKDLDRFVPLKNLIETFGCVHQRFHAAATLGNKMNVLIRFPIQPKKKKKAFKGRT
jgi:hypothetical protein